MITLHSVSKEVGRGQFKTLVLDNINWAIQRRCRIAILGQRGSGTSVLLDTLAGISLPTRGWVDRHATVSIPGGFLRYSRFGTPRQLITRLGQLYRANPQDIIKFITSGMQRQDILDVPVRQLPAAIRQQLNMALTYAVPCDFYLFDGAIEAGRNREFRAFCRQAFTMRSQQAGSVFTTNSSRIAAGLGEDFMGGVLFRSKLTLYKRLADAIAVFDSLPLEETASIPRETLMEEEPAQDQEDVF